MRFYEFFDTFEEDEELDDFYKRFNSRFKGNVNNKKPQRLTPWSKAMITVKCELINSNFYPIVDDAFINRAGMKKLAKVYMKVITKVLSIPVSSQSIVYWRQKVL